MKLKEVFQTVKTEKELINIARGNITFFAFYKKYDDKNTIWEQRAYNQKIGKKIIELCQTDN